MASSLASTSSLPSSPSPQSFDEEHRWDYVEGTKMLVYPSRVSSPPEMREKDASALCSRNIRPVRTSNRRWTRAPSASATSSQISAAQKLSSFLKMGIACLIMVLAIASEPVKADNFTQLTGTWASGSGRVLTGLDFYNPITRTFNMPTSGGVSYSFVEDLPPNGGHFETSTFTFTSNSVTNRCFTAALTWQHGTFTVNANGSLSLTPYAADGRVQVMDPCAAESTAQYLYNQFELIPYWYSYIETLTGFSEGTAHALQMYNDDGTGASGAAKNVMYLVSRPPQMLPTEQLFETVLNSS